MKNYYQKFDYEPIDIFDSASSPAVVTLQESCKNLQMDCACST